MTIHDAWASSASTPPPSGDLRMDEVTAHQLADELTTLAASMFGLLQPHSGSDPAASQAPSEARTASPEAPSIQDPASVVSVAIPVEPVAIAVPESWASPEADAEATEGEPAAPLEGLEVPSLAVPSLAVPELAPAAEPPSGHPTLRLVEPIEVLDGLDKLDHRESRPDQRESELDQREPETETEPEPPAPRQSMTLLNEIAFLDD
jgi:hypothetical protein